MKNMSFSSSHWGNLIAGAITRTTAKLYQIAGGRISITAFGGDDHNVKLIFDKLKQAYLNSRKREPVVTKLLLAKPPSLTLIDKILAKAPWFYAIVAPITAGATGLLALQYIHNAKTGEQMIIDYMASRELHTIDLSGFFEALNLTSLQDVVHPYASSLEELIDLPEETFQLLDVTPVGALIELWEKYNCTRSVDAEWNVSSNGKPLIEGYLGDMFEVLPSYGHVWDLAARSGSVRPDEDFSMVWEVPSAAWTHLKS
ncbi:DNA topoisomerase, type IA [Tanacetum coccineum]